MPTLPRRLLLWTVICVVSAAPSFFFAQREFDRAAMVVGVCLFIAGYTAATSTPAFARFHRRPFVRRTLYIGYGLRLALSLMCPIGFVAAADATLRPMVLVAFADVLPGILSVNLVKGTGIKPESFHGTLLTTIVQGALLNLIVFAVMLVVYMVQRLFLTAPPPEPDDVHGFDVVMPAQLPAAPAVTPVATPVPEDRP